MKKKLNTISNIFNPHGPNVNKIITRNIHLLLNNANVKELYPKKLYYFPKKGKITCNSYFYEK